MTTKGTFESLLDTKPQHVRLLGTSPLKKGQFTEQTEAGMSAIQMQTVRALRNVKHVYDFGSLLVDFFWQEDDMRGALLGEASDLLEAGAFRLPYEEVCYSYLQDPNHGDPALVERNQGYKPSIMPTERIPMMAYLRQHPVTHEITMSFLSVSLQGNWCAMPVYLTLEADGTLLMLNTGPWPDETMTLLYSVLLIATLLLVKNAPVYADDDMAVTKKRNALRRALGKKPLPETIHRVKHINLVTVLAHPTGTPGSPKVPHDRAGHWRRVEGGGQVWVRDSKIHGGAASRIIHDVKD